MSKPKTHYKVFTVTHHNFGKWINLCKSPSNLAVSHPDEFNQVECSNCQRMIDKTFPDGVYGKFATWKNNQKQTGIEK